MEILSWLGGLPPLELWLALQVALEAVLVLLMIVFLVRLRRLSHGATVPDGVAQAMERFLTESEKLSAAFNETLRQKKELSLSLLLKLERKINEINQLLEQADQRLSQAAGSQPDPGGSDKANPAAPENRALVLRLADRGLSVEEIARQAKLHRGEVELILDLEKQLSP
ncbi:MAG: hypothetical protein AB1896_09510 [Thermodesulfobacteriota bacterium]